VVITTARASIRIVITIAPRRALRTRVEVRLGAQRFVLLVEAAVGWWTHSRALRSDAAHMVSDVMPLIVAPLAIRLASRGATAGRTFGIRRAEPVAAFFYVLGLVLACIFIFVEASERLVSGPPAVPCRC